MLALAVTAGFIALGQDKKMRDKFKFIKQIGILQNVLNWGDYMDKNRRKKYVYKYSFKW